MQVLLLRSLAGISLAIEVDVVPAVPVVALTTTNYEAVLCNVKPILFIRGVYNLFWYIVIFR